MADKPEQTSGLSIQTLLISAAAAVAAATIVPMFWEHGTIFATAMTPVVVALGSEGPGGAALDRRDSELGCEP